LKSIALFGQLSLRAFARILVLLVALAVFSQAHAAYFTRYSTTTNGAITFTGNTLGLDKAASANAPGVSGAIGTFTTVDTTQVDGTYPAGTTANWRLNSSMANLVLPAGSTVLYAELIWSGSYSYGGENVSANLNDAVGLKTPLSNNSILPDATSAQTLGAGTVAGACTTTPCYYVRSANVTNLVRSAGAGSYTISGVPATQGNTENNANAAGWTLAVIYQNGSLPSRNLSLFVGAEVAGSAPASVSGFCTPPTGPRSGRLLVSALEGDQVVTGDQMAFGPTSATVAAISGPNNPVGNFFLGQINNDAGLLDTSGTFGSRNHTAAAAVSGARQGYDITNVDVSARLNNNQTVAFAQGITAGDNYMINALALQINVGAPIFPVSVKAVDKAITKVGEFLTYTISVDNTTGTADAVNTVFTDPLPAGLSFVVSSFTLDGVATAGDPAVGINIGTIAAGAKKTVSFKVRVDSIPAAPSIAEYNNQARWNYDFIPCAGQPVVKGSIITNPSTTKIARLAMSKVASPSGTLNPNDLITYTLSMTNDGTADSSGATLLDPIPAGTAYVAGSTKLNSVAVSDVTGAMPWITNQPINSAGAAAGVIAFGKTAQIVFQVKVNANASGTIDNRAVGDIDGPTGGAPAVNATTNNPIGSVADLSVVKTGPSTLSPNGSAIYNITISNAGPSAANGASFNDVLPSAIQGISASCASAAGGAACPSLISVVGNTVSGTIATLPAGGSVVLAVSGTVAASAANQVDNTVTVTPPAGTADPSNANNSSTSSAVVNPIADLVVVKSGPSASSAGNAITYTVTIRNNGPSAANNATFNDTVPASILGVSASCGLANGGAICPAAINVTGNTVSGAVPTLPAGASLVISVKGTVSGSATGTISNTATVLPPGGVTDPDPSNSTSTINTTLGAVADVAVAKSGPGAAVPGSNVSYTIVVSNAGPSAANGTTFTDAVPASLTGVSASCTTSSGGATCPSSITVVGNNVNGTVTNFPANSSVTIVVSGTVSASAIGSIVNTASVTPPLGVTDPTPGNNSSNTATAVSPTADLSIVKTGPASVSAGGTMIYTIVVTNNGPSDVFGASVSDNSPSDLSGIAVLCTSTTNGAQCPSGFAISGTSIAGTIPLMPVGSTVIVTITGVVSGSASAPITNNARITSPASTPDLNLGNNVSSVTTTIGAIAKLSIVKTGPAAINAGTGVAYNIVISNAGPSSANGATFNDNVPSSISGITASCISPSGGAVCPASVSVTGNAVSGVVPTLPAGGSVTIAIAGTANASATGAITNTATLTAPAGVSDPDTTDNSSTTSSPVNAVADVAIVKSGPSTANAGGVISYTLLISNAGPSAANGTSFSDVVSANINGLTATCSSAANGAACVVPSISGNTVGGTIPSLPVGGSVVITITGTVNGSATGTIVNQASVSTAGSVTDPTPGNNQSQLSTAIVPQANLSISKIGPANVNAGGAISYSVTLSNAGPSAANLASFSDLVPASVSGLSATCSTATGGAVCPAAITVTGNLVGAAVPILPAGSSVVITIDGTVSGSATGSIINSASLAAPPGVVDPDVTNNTSTATTAVTPVADLVMNKTGPASFNAGASITYNLVIRNLGPSAANGASFSDVVPAAISAISATCSAATGAAQCPASILIVGNTVSGNVGALPFGSTVTIAITGTIAAGATGSISNSASVNPPAGVTDPNLTNNISTISTPVVPTADLSIVKSSPAAATPGASITFDLVISNAGPSAANAATFTDAVPTSITGVSAVCINPISGALCPSTVTVAGNSVTGSIPALPAGSSVTIRVSGQIAAGAVGAISNTASVTPPSGTTDPSSGNNSSTAITTLQPAADLAVTKVKVLPAGNLVPGQAVQYKIEVTNLGPSNVTGVQLLDAIPVGLASFSWNCTVSGVADCDSLAAGTGATGTSAVALNNIQLNAGAANKVTVLVDAIVAASAIGSITNTAIAALPSGFVDPNTANHTASVTTPVTLTADVTVSKTGPSTINAGGIITYSIVVSNAGPSAADGSSLADTVPVGIVGVSARCSSSTGGAVCPASLTVSGNNVNAVVPTLPAGGSATFTVIGTISGSSPNTLVNTASVNLPPTVVDPTPGNNSSVSTTVVPVADLSIIKVGPSAVNAGGSITYNITIRNAGPSTAVNALFADSIPASINSIITSCAGEISGAVCPSVITKTGNSLTALIPSLPSGASLTITVAGVVSGSATGVIANTATIAVPAGTIDPDPTNNSSTENTSVTPTADIGILKTAPLTVDAGAAITYTVVVSNAGPSAADDTVFADLVPAAISGVSATCASTTGAAVCPSSVNVSGNNVSGSIPSLPANSSVTITINGTVSGSATGNINNRATITPAAGVVDSSPSNNSFAVDTAVNLVSNLTLVKTAPASVQPLQPLVYTIVVTNKGPSAVTNAAFADNVPSVLTGVSATCGAATGGATCPNTIAVAGNAVSALIPNMPAFSTLTFSVRGTVPAGATGDITNTASITPPANVTDPVPADNTSSATTTVNAVADLTISKSAPASTLAGGPIRYTITVSNAGPSAAGGTSVSDAVPATITGVTATCAIASGAAVCPSVIGVSGNNVSATVPTLPANSSVTFTVSGTVNGSATGSITNNAVLTPPANVTDSTPNNTASATTSITPVANLSVIKTSPAAVNAGAGISYQIKIKNAGPSTANAASFADAVPDFITGVAASCLSATGGAACPSPVSVVGNLVSGLVAALPAGGEITINVVGTVAASTTGTVSNTATVTTPSGTVDPDPSDNSSTASTPVNPVADLQVTKTAPAVVNAGGLISYTVRVFNAGPSAANSTNFTDLVPSTVAGVSASCGGVSGGAVCPALVGVTGNQVNAGIPTLPAGGALFFTVNGTVAGGATGVITNTASATTATGVLDPDTSNNSSSANTTVQPVADIRVTKSGPASANAGSQVNYTIVVVNTGPSAANGTTMLDNVPVSLTGVIATCTGTTGGAICPTVNVSGNAVSATLATLPLGSTVSFNVQATVLNAALGAITNSVSVTPPAGVIDPDTTNNTALSSSPVTPVADIKIVKTGPSNVNAGAAIQYQLQISNAGPSVANLVSFSDLVPNAIAGVTASCGAATAGAACPVLGVVGNAINGTVATMPPGSSLVITVNGAVSGTASGSMTNTASVSLPASFIDPDPTNNQSSVTTSITPVANLSMVKTGSSAANAAGPISYTLVVSNAGPSSAGGAIITDNVPASINTLNAICASATGGAVCPSTLSFAGNALSAIVPTLPANASVTITINGIVDGTATGAITNTASVTAAVGTIDPDVSNNSGTASVPVTPVADLKIEKFAVPALNATDAIIYTIKVTNLGPSTALNSVMTDPVPAQVGGITAVCGTAQGGALCPASIVVVGNNVSATIPSLPAGASVLFTVKGQLVSTASGPVTNRATIAPAVGVVDPNLSNNGADYTTIVTPIADVSVTKVKVLPAGAVQPGGEIAYDIVIRNAGPSPVTDVKMSDVLPTVLSNTRWTCVASAGADCDSSLAGTGASGTGNPALSAITLDGSGNATVTIRVVATVAANAQFSIVNTATIVLPTTVLDPNPANNWATDTSAVVTTLQGRVFADTLPDGIQSGAEAGLSGLTVTLIPTGSGAPIVVTTDANGNYIAPVLPATEYTVVVTAPAGQAATTRNNPQKVRSNIAGSVSSIPAVGFAVASSVSGTVWRDLNHDRSRGGSEPLVAGFKVEVLDPAGKLITSALTDANGAYSIGGLVPTNPNDPNTKYVIRFRDPANNVVYGRPVSKDPTNPNGFTANGLIEALTLLPGINTSNQNLPLDPSGVVYDSSTRLPVAGAAVSISGPAGFDPAKHLLGGLTAQGQVTTANGFYQFLLLPGAPEGEYRLSVTAPSGYISPSLQIPAQTTVLPVGNSGNVIAVQPQETAPLAGQSTTYYLAVNLRAGGNDVVNNHIPLDPAQPSELFVTKVADKVEAEVGDSVLYTVSVRNAGGPSATSVMVNDRLPPGFRYVASTTTVTRANATGGGQTSNALADPIGGVGPVLNFNIGALKAGEALRLTYRVRLGVGSQQGDGINRAQASSGNAKSNVAQAKVKVTGGVFTTDACIVGKIFIDCNGNHIQDAEELGIPGVRLYMEDGMYLVSDTEGKYSYCGVKPITHVLKVDRKTLPVGAALTTSSNRNAVDPGSLFLDVRMGELHRADFVEGTCKPEVLDQVKARRAQGNVVAPETEKAQPGLIFRSKPGDSAKQEMKLPVKRDVQTPVASEPGGQR
jgi:uncharacterized repeat protein (TIGR01451 family)